VASLRSDLTALHGVGAISDAVMSRFDAICLPPMREFRAADIARLREGLDLTQSMVAWHLNTTASTVRRWERGDTQPTGTALKLLHHCR